MTPARSFYRLAGSSLILAFISHILAFAVFATNIHDGSRFLMGRWIEFSLLWPLLLLKPKGLAGLPGFIGWMALSFAGYFVMSFFLLLALRGMLPRPGHSSPP